MKQIAFPAGEGFEIKLAPAIAYTRAYLLANGTRGFNLDQMTGDLHISKKTLYKYFSTKDEFIEFVLLKIYEEMFADARNVTLEDDDPLKCFYELMKVMFRHISMISPKTTLDVKLFYPRVWQEVDNFQQEIIDKVLVSFQKADNLGLLRKHFDLKFTADLIVKIVRATFQPETYINAPYTITEMIHFFVDIMMNGLMKKDKFFSFTDNE